MEEASASVIAPPISGVIDPPRIAPVDQAERITALDTLRGFALLGILLMNIVGFGLYVSSYDNPTVAGGATGPNLAVWTVMHVLAEGKMRCLFSMVFGASVILLTQRVDRTGEGADIYYRRTLWLMAFGIVHAYLLWYGDILYPYGLCGLALYPFRKMSARGLLTVGFLLVIISGAAFVNNGYARRTVILNGRAAVQASAEGKKLTPEQQEAKTSYENWMKRVQPSAEEIEKDAKRWRGNPWEVIKARAALVNRFNAISYYAPDNWDIWSMMFIGMGLMKLGILGGERSYRFYAALVAIGYGIGIPLNSYTAWLIIKSNFDPPVHEFANSTYDLGRLSIALGHLGMIMILCKAGALRWLMSRLGAIGQMAFSNYILQSVICAFLFTGYGFALYGRLQRYQLYYVVAAIWVLQLLLSPIWLRHFRFGPLEWGWRSLTYWRRQPMRWPQEMRTSTY